MIGLVQIECEVEARVEGNVNNQQRCTNKGPTKIYIGSTYRPAFEEGNKNN